MLTERVEDVYQCSSPSQCCSSCVSSVETLVLIVGEHLEISLPNNKQNAEENKRPIPGTIDRQRKGSSENGRRGVGESLSFVEDEEEAVEEKSNSFRFV